MISSIQIFYLIIYFFLFFTNFVKSEVLSNYLLKPRPFLGRCYAGNNLEGVTLRYCRSPYCLLGFYIFLHASKKPTRIEFYSCGTPTKQQKQNFLEICIKNTDYPIEACQNALESITQCTDPRSQGHFQATVTNLWSVCCEGWRCNRPESSLEHNPRVQKCNLKKIGCPVDDEAPSLTLGYPKNHSPIFEIFLPILGFAFILVFIIYGCLYCSIKREGSKRYISHLKLKRAFQLSLTFETGRSTNFEAATSFIFIKNFQGKTIDQELGKILNAIAKKQFVRLGFLVMRLQKLKHYKICAKLSRLFPRTMRKIGQYIPNEVELCFRKFQLVHPHVLVIAKKLLAEYRLEQTIQIQKREFNEESTSNNQKSDFSNNLSLNIKSTVYREESQPLSSIALRPIQENKIDPESPLNIEEDLDSDEYIDEEMTEEQMHELRRLVRSIADKSDWSDTEDEEGMS